MEAGNRGRIAGRIPSWTGEFRNPTRDRSTRTATDAAVPVGQLGKCEPAIAGEFDDLSWVQDVGVNGIVVGGQQISVRRETQC